MWPIFNRSFFFASISKLMPNFLEIVETPINSKLRSKLESFKTYTDYYLFSSPALQRKLVFQFIFGLWVNSKKLRISMYSNVQHIDSSSYSDNLRARKSHLTLVGQNLLWIVSIKLHLPNPKQSGRSATVNDSLQDCPFTIWANLKSLNFVFHLLNGLGQLSWG